jgi:type IV pilus assembly protein PilA
MKGSKEAGFSLVELIVVIAIMAVLVGVLAPAYLKYVEKSRKSSDISAIDQVLDAANAVATDLEYHVPADTVFCLTAENGVVNFTMPVWGDETDINSTSDNYWQLALTEWKDTSNKGDPYKMASKEWAKGDGTLSGTVALDGVVAWKIDGSSGVFKDMCDYSKEFSSRFE